MAIPLAQRAGFFALAAADAEAARNDDALDVGRSAGVQRRDRIALEVFDRAAERSPALVLRKHRRTGDPQHLLGDVEARELAAEAVLRAFIRARLPGMRKPVIAQREKTRDLRFDEELDELGAGARIVG